MSELVGHNCRGRGKPAIDEVKMQKVKEVTLAWFPVKPGEIEVKAWRDCQKNIDTALRSKKYSA